jgi:hypothetical protein
LADTSEGLAWAVGILEGASVDGHADDKLASCDAVLRVVLNGLLGVEGSAGRIGRRWIPVSVVARVGVPGARIVVSPDLKSAMGAGERSSGIHQVPEIKVSIHLGELEFLIMSRA